jgi:hypothetical protein
MPNHPRHGLMGIPKERSALNAGAHVPQKIESGYKDSNGYEDSHARRNGKQTGSIPPGDSRKRVGAEGNSKGSPPPGVGKGGKGVRGTPQTHLGTAGRGGSGRHGKGDSYKGKPTGMTESPSSEWFERLGSD